MDEKKLYNNIADKSNFIKEEHTEVSEYYKNYRPNPLKTWIKDSLTKIIVIIAILALYLVVIHIFNSALFGTDASPEEIQQGFTDMV